MAGKHRRGIVAHVTISISPGVDIWEAHGAISNERKPAGVRLEELHIGLGEIDMIADVWCGWTNPRGSETRQIGDWVNRIRKLTDADGRFYVKRTSTLVCMIT